MYIKIDTEEVFSFGDLRKKHENVSFPVINGSRKPSADWLDENGYAELQDQKPEVPQGKMAVRQSVEKVDGVYRHVYVLQDIPYETMRRAEYPEIGDQLDAIMKWLATETEFVVPAELKSIAMKCMSIKAKYPKPKGGG